MTAKESSVPRSAELVRHLNRFPEDLRDIRRLQRRFGLSVGEAARALEAWQRQEGTQPLRSIISH